MIKMILMCAGKGAKGTLPRIARGYFGDHNAPESFTDNDVANDGFIAIGLGAGPVKIVPFSHKQ